MIKKENLYSPSGKLIKGLILITPIIYKDDRGFFMESWNKKAFKSIGLDNVTFVQDNHSSSCKGVLRGLHYQAPPNAQGKMVQCIYGEIFDVVIDIRSSSSTFGEWVGLYLNQRTYQQLWIPEGFAHGFVTISDHAEVLYKVTNYWSSNAERVLAWNDPAIAIQWPLSGPFQISEKDSNAPLLSEMARNDIF